jgi:outer membrane immunogenic protein
MSRILFAGIFALTATGSALAADLPPPAAPPPRAPAAYVPVIAPAYSWSGIYLGINGGYQFGTSDWTGQLGGSTGNFNTNGFLIGGTVGANYQMGSFVLGVEADDGWSNLKGNSGGGCGTLGAGIGGGPPATTNCETKSDWLGTARARLGWAWDRVLVYGTGGAAFGNVQAGFNPPFAVAGSSFNSQTEFGWTAGAGVEFAFAQNWTGKVEYLFVDLENGSCTTACNFVGAGGVTTTPNIGVKYYENLVRGGINYKFGW